MADYPSQSPVAAMRATVQSIEAKLRQGHLPQDGLDDLKSAIDDARLRAGGTLESFRAGTDCDGRTL